MERLFCMRKSHIYAAMHTISPAAYKLAMKYLQDPSIWHDRMPMYAATIYQKCGLIPNIWGFIDGTLRKICRLGRYQEECYTWFRKCHAIKFQSIVAPMMGPYVGRGHDAKMLTDHSGLVEQLDQLMPPDGSNGTVFALFGNMAYPACPHLLKGFVNPKQGSTQAEFNSRMSSSRIAVEWGFAHLTQQWTYVNFQASMKIYKELIGQ